MLLACFAFIIAGLVEFEVEAGDTTLKNGETKLVMFNALPTSLPSSFMIKSTNMNITFSVQPGEVRLSAAVRLQLIVAPEICIAEQGA